MIEWLFFEATLSNRILKSCLKQYFHQLNQRPSSNYLNLYGLFFNSNDTKKLKNNTKQVSIH